ncbi:hypothetical protein PROVRETT_05439 [Providencia rettgeri DSM 1131]|nr:hypothetical protein PROVRETT_05439 [Providencia rettgeri DSM 1131]
MIAIKNKLCDFPYCRSVDRAAFAHRSYSSIRVFYGKLLDEN